MINSEIFVTTGMVWPVSSDKWKTPLVPCEQVLHVSTSLSYFFMLHVGILYIAVASGARGAAVFQTLSDSLRALAAFSLTVTVKG